MNRGSLPESQALSVLNDLADLRIQRYAHTPLLGRAFELCSDATIYDALYLALAEGLDAPFLTRERALAGIPGCAAHVEVIGEDA